MSKRHNIWMQREIPGLVDAGLIDKETGTRLADHYQLPDEGKGNGLLIALFAIMGSALIGGGIILLFAHNWTELGRPARAILSLAPLALSWCFGCWVLHKRPNSIGLRESAATLITLSACAALGLISQTYHFMHGLDEYLRIWMLMIIPVVYFFRSSVATTLYLTLLPIWAGFAQSVYGHATSYWILLGLILPFCSWQIIRHKNEKRTALLNWALALSFTCAWGITLERALPGWWIIAYMVWFATLYLFGRLHYATVTSLWQKPFQLIGGAGICLLSFALSYEELWDNIGWFHYRSGAGYFTAATVFDYVITGILLLIGAASALKLLHRATALDRWLALAPIVASVYFALASFEWNWVGPILTFNAYLALLGLICLIHGVRAVRIGLVNVGMMLLSAILIARFLDSSFNFVERGYAFVLLGIAFLVANLRMIKRKKRQT